MCDPVHDETPLGPGYQVPDHRAFRHVDPRVLSWFLAFLRRWALAGLIERVVLTGRRAIGDNMDGMDGLQASHDFMIVLDEQAPDDVLTGMPGYPAFLHELHSAAREANVVAMNVMLCRRSHWVGLNGNDELLKLMRRGPIVAARL